MSDQSANLREQALEEAALWFASLQDEQVSEQERQAWQKWLAESVWHREAWAKVDQIDREFHQLPAQRSFQALQSAGRSRRQFLYGLAGAAVALPFAWHQRDILQAAWTPGTLHQTAVGERRQLALADGSQLWLNTNTLITVDERAERRQLFLLHGELYLQSSPKTQALRINTDYGSVDMMNTELNIRLGNNSAHLAVTTGEARVQLAEDTTPVTVAEKESLAFNQTRSVLTEGISANDEAWRKGYLVAENMRLEDFLKALGRYHSQGWLKCSDAVANLRLIGHYPIADTRKVLDTLAQSLPVKVRQITPWFTLIEDNRNISHS